MEVEEPAKSYYDEADGEVAVLEPFKEVMTKDAVVKIVSN